MKLTYYSNTSILAEANGKKILFDPWLTGSAYYGSWVIFPELTLDFSQFDDIDYIHISHIHPDHLHKETLKKLPDVPVLIHKWDSKFVKRNLEQIGKEVIELEHGEQFNIGNGVALEVYAADGCNPELCKQFFGCGKISHPSKSVGIDTFSLLSDGKIRLAQINDCPFELAQSSIEKLKPVDCLLVGYTAASSYPQCWYKNKDEIVKKHGPEKIQRTLNHGLNFLRALQPRVYMPYAGTYLLAGKYNYLNKYKGDLTREAALYFYQNHYRQGLGFFLNPTDRIDLPSLSIDYNFNEPDENKEAFLQRVSSYKYDYDDDPDVTVDELKELCSQAYKRYTSKRQELGYFSSTNIYIYLSDDCICKLPHIDGLDLSFVDKIQDNNYVSMKMDSRLLKRLLLGPKYANFNNADIGSHIEYYRQPDIYERNLYYLMNFFHS